MWNKDDILYIIELLQLLKFKWTNVWNAYKNS